MPSKNMISCSLKKTTGSMLGRPRSAYRSRDPLADEAQVEPGLQVAVEVVLGNEVLQRDGNRLVEAAGFRRAEHGSLQGEGTILLGMYQASSRVRCLEYGTIAASVSILVPRVWF